MKKITLLGVCLLICLHISATHALTEFITVLQSDGTQLSIRKYGNGDYSYRATLDGVPVLKDQKGDYCYADFNDDNSLKNTRIVAHNKEKRSFFESKMVSELNKTRRNTEQVNTGGRMTRSNSQQSYAPIRSKGSPTVPVVLVEFPDKPFSRANVLEAYENHFNKNKYTEEGNTGSVSDFFVEQSRSLFQPRFDVVAKVVASKTYYEYGQNSKTGGDIGFITLGQEVITKAVEAGVDFSKYDCESFVFVFAGIGEQYVGANDSCLWPKTVFSITIRANDGKTFNSFAGINELSLQSPTQPKNEGIGMICHEFSHLLGLPDFYGPEGVFGLSRWSLMDYGYYNNDSRSPVGYTGYELSYLEWIEPVILEPTKQIVTLPHLESEDRIVYKIPNPHDVTGNEYYLLENHQPSQSRWFPSETGSGMLVFHVEFNASAWSANTVNTDAKHQRMTIIPADGELTIGNKKSYYQGDPFPGLLGKTELTSTTIPCDTAYTGRYMGVIMKNIKETDGVITFTYMADGVLEATKGITFRNTSDTSFEVVWQSVDSADDYLISLNDEDSELLSDTTTNTSYVFDNLLPDHEYTVNIVALSTSYINSPKAGEKVRTNTPSDIETLLRDNPNAMGKVYTLGGVYLKTLPLIEIAKAEGLKSGIYLVVVNGGSYKLKIGNRK